MSIDKKGVVKAGILVLVVVMLLFFVVNGILSFAETPEEEKARLEAELAQLEEELLVIEGGKWVNYSCGISNIFYRNYNCDNLTGYHTVCISNISHYVSNYCGLMPEEALKVKLRILAIKNQKSVENFG